MTDPHKVTFVCETFIYANSLHAPLFLWRKMIINSKKMEQIPNRQSYNQSHTYYITYTHKIFNGIEPKYQKARHIIIVTMCPNPDPNLYLSYWKFV